ncbi:MAG: DUF4158 domain-containing protein [Ktedonobacteraceae bacterium]|nr:DUF4158 domain-containing protein [Ktedonobacteraceae bacterium]
MTPEQRHLLIEIPADLSDREIARYYTFSQKDLDLIKQKRRLHKLCCSACCVTFPYLEKLR